MWHATMAIPQDPGGLFPLSFSSPAFCPFLMNGVHTAHECSRLPLLILPVPFCPLWLFQSLSSELTHKVSSGCHSKTLPFLNYRIPSFQSSADLCIPSFSPKKIKSRRNAVQSCWCRFNLVLARCIYVFIFSLNQTSPPPILISVVTIQCFVGVLV